MNAQGHREIAVARIVCGGQAGIVDPGHLHAGRITTELELQAPSTMIATVVMPGHGNPDHVHLPDLGIVTVAMEETAETEGIAPIGEAIAIIRDREAVRDLRLEKLKEKELSNISKLTKGAETITDNRTRNTDQETKQK